MSRDQSLVCDWRSYVYNYWLLFLWFDLFHCFVFFYILWALLIDIMVNLFFCLLNLLFVRGRNYDGQHCLSFRRLLSDMHLHAQRYTTVVRWNFTQSLTHSKQLRPAFLLKRIHRSCKSCHLMFLKLHSSL